LLITPAIFGKVPLGLADQLTFQRWRRAPIGAIGEFHPNTYLMIMPVIIPHLEQQKSTVIIAGLAQTLRAVAKAHKKRLKQTRPRAYRELVEETPVGIRDGCLQGMEPDEEEFVRTALRDLTTEALKLP